LLQSALAQFPGERAPVLEHAWLAFARRDWPEAARRWDRVRETAPDNVEGYLRGAGALNEMWQFKEAEELLLEGMRRFPKNSGLACDYAWMALSQRREDEAAQRFRQVRESFPSVAAGYIGGALCLRNQFRLREAEQLLERGCTLVPNEPRILLEQAQLAVFRPLRSGRDYGKALKRLESLRAKFPQFEEGYTVTIRLMRDDDRLAEADEFGTAATRQLPHSSAVAVEHAHTARARADWPEALRRYADARERFPRQPHGIIGLASVLSSSGQHADGEAVAREAMERFPGEKLAFAEFASIAVRQSNWKEALERWNEAYRRFPDEKAFAQRIFEARLRLTESDGSEAEAAVQERPAAGAIDPRAEMRELIMQFESLGGRGIGCEFGMFQREFAAEPLGLLRWADMPYEGIIFVLENRFEGVGLAENTELFVDREHAQPEYCTVDKRGFMFQRSFIVEDDISFEKMWKQTIRRLPFLRDKLISDLEAGSKIFLWRQTERNLTDAEIDRLHRAVHSYGNNTLLYVGYQDDTHPNGTVEWAAPGLLIGYIDRFKQLPTGELVAAPASASWTAICRKAYDLWKERKESDSSSSSPSLSPLPTDETAAAPVAASWTAIWAKALESSTAIVRKALALWEQSKKSDSSSPKESSGNVADAKDEPAARDLVTQFESLGGTGHGCEFGIFQRSLGAEPLGLLRWAGLTQQELTEALEKRFDGVGLPEHTNVFVPPDADEYWTTDQRYAMAMRSFIRTDEVTREKVTKMMHKRLQFLRTKLIEDLERGDKIFVYKNLYRDLTDEELGRLHAAVRSYGDNTLLYVRYEQPGRPSGTVEIAGAGLMIGYIDHFAFSPDDQPLESADEGWLAVCRRAFQLWSQMQARENRQVA
jgi:tetratricopeptide (TPR) repeat protein